VPLATLAQGVPATVRRIDEELEARPDAMRDLERLQLMPGCPVRLDSQDERSVQLTTGSGPTSLDVDVATRVYVSA
jgi:hypothetical protein